jgi:hypothetical protein
MLIRMSAVIAGSNEISDTQSKSSPTKLMEPGKLKLAIVAINQISEAEG